LREKINYGIKAYQNEYGELSNIARLAHGVIGTMTGREVLRLLSYEPLHVLAYFTKILAFLGLGYVTLETLGSAIMGVDFPIGKYLERRQTNEEQ
jgi:hypothetical protein